MKEDQLNEIINKLITYIIHIATNMVVNINPNISDSRLPPIHCRIKRAGKACEFYIYDHHNTHLPIRLWSFELSTPIANINEPTNTIFGSCIYGEQAASVDRMPNNGNATTGSSAVTGTGTASVDQ